MDTKSSKIYLVPFVTILLLAPAHPARAECQVIGQAATYGQASGVVASGQYALVADRLAGLTILDIGDPALPVIAGTVGFPEGGYSLHLAAAGHYAYCGGDSVRIVDWEDPTQPVIVGEIHAGWPYGVAVQGNLLYVADHGFGLKIVDVSDPTLPVIIGQLHTPGRVHRVSVDGTYAYLVGCSCQLFVVDVSDPTQPQLIGSSAYLRGVYEGIAVEGGLAFTSGSGPMRIFDVQVPSDPQLIATVDFDSGRGLGYAWPFAYVSTGNEVYDTGSVVVVNVSQPAAPSIVRTVETPGYGWGLAADANYVYGAVGYGGLCILTTELEPALVGEGAPPPAASRLTVVPNPSHGPAMLWCDLASGGPGRLEIFDAGGRLLRSQDTGLLPAGRSGIALSGVDDAGRSLSPGVLYLRLVQPSGSTQGRMIVLP